MFLKHFFETKTLPAFLRVLSEHAYVSDSRWVLVICNLFLCLARTAVYMYMTPPIMVGLLTDRVIQYSSVQIAGQNCRRCRHKVVQKMSHLPLDKQLQARHAHLHLQRYNPESPPENNTNENPFKETLSRPNHHIL